MWGGHRMLLLILLIILSILPMFVNWEGQIGSNYGYSLVWFIALYITGAFLQRKRVLNNRNPKKVLLYLMLFGVSTIALYVIPKIVGFVGISLNLAMYNSVVVYTQAICLFMAFGNLSPAKCFEKTIGCISGLALASYLLHCQEDIEKHLWVNANPAAYANSGKIILVAAVICITVFITGSILEYMRKKVCKLMKIDKWFAGTMSRGYLLLETFLK